MKIPAPKFEVIPSDHWWQRRRYRLTEDWIPFRIGGHQIIFPKGFETDLASVPRLMWWIPGFNPTGPLLYGSIPHDFGFQYQYLLAVYDVKAVYPEESYALREKFPHLFNGMIPVLVGRPQEDFDYLLSSVTSKATGAGIVAESARAALAVFGRFAWRKYREYGPGAYNGNSLGLPGLTVNGAVI